MKKLSSTNYSAGAFNFAIFLLRVSVGILMMHHGYQKLTHFDETKAHIPNFLGLSSTISATLLVFAEFFCSIFVLLGLFTRLAVIPLVIASAFALAKGHNWDVFGQGELITHYLAAYLVLLFVGPGRISIDGMIK